MHLEKNPNGIWYCRFKQNERWLRTSLRTSNKRQAQRKLSNLDLGLTQRERLAEASQRWLREQETRSITEKHLRDIRRISVELNTTFGVLLENNVEICEDCSHEKHVLNPQGWTLASPEKNPAGLQKKGD